ncbi:esterase-like activity of phytase family protein [Paucibacter sp. APW11]|uniref:Esterase-like activity of phytase family protein n=1 Tax=Roseateles aquae TaxID=3077235 RepID=A0ABU3P9L7_9BURK|nr:esterase-like activity of phytase family protein [Paucibacter sp. APW11]MDT8998783.1 esterase-like activity of phytase family protein [Paucibacter sp. APW11]
MTHSSCLASRQLLARLRPHRLSLAAAFCALTLQVQASPQLVATGSLSGLLHDQSGQSALLENGVAGDLLGGLGSGLAWAGGTTFIGLPDRGPNAKSWNSALDDTTSFIPRLQTLSLTLAPQAGKLPFALTAQLSSSTLLYSNTALNYGAATPSLNNAGKFYFSGRSDNFAAGSSLNASNARLDPEALRLSNDGRSVFISDEYGPYVYQFDRATGQRLKSFALPGNLAIAKPSSQGAAEIAGNSSGRVANKGMEGLAITPDGKTLVGFMQSPLIQDGGDGGAANRIISIDIASGATRQFAYNNYDALTKKNYNSSEILALNNHEFLVLERDGKGLGDDSNAKFKSIYKVDLANASDVSGLSGEASLLGKAPAKTLFLDIKKALNDQGITDDQIPAKLEGMSFGADITVGGAIKHTLYIANDNDFIATTAGGKSNPNQWFVFAFSDADLNGSVYLPQQISAVPEPQQAMLLASGLLAIAGLRRRRR